METMEENMEENTLIIREIDDLNDFAWFCFIYYLGGRDYWEWHDHYEYHLIAKDDDDKYGYVFFKVKDTEINLNYYLFVFSSWSCLFEDIMVNVIEKKTKGMFSVTKDTLDILYEKDFEFEDEEEQVIKTRSIKVLPKNVGEE